MKNLTSNFLFSTSFFFLLITLSLVGIGCEKADDNSADSYTITVSAFMLSNNVYVDTGNDLIFDSNKECQTWSRTAQADAHNSASHLHYNAAANVSYNSADSIFSWDEFGPELSQADISSACSIAKNGASKTVNTTSYYQDKPNLYLKITNVVKN